ncbi:MAG: peptidylprolyl isomerase [Verrucomicrobiota bacterium]
MIFAFWATAPAQTITNQPQSITVNNASSAAFTVGASNATGYQWQFNTTNLTDGTNDDGVIISGSAASVLTLEDVITNEAGSYTVIASNLTNSVTSSNAVLAITNGTIVRFILSGFPGGGTSNLDVQLFDHDKPATVENFIHYVSSGAYANMFFDRCNPEFVLQGGDDGASDRTNTTPPLTGWDIVSYTSSNQFNPPFPPQLQNEFGFGPLIHNRFGTIAMALNSETTNSATSGFFFNLVDNSSDLDGQNFTVFGRILNNSNELVSSNMLAYFNTLSVGDGEVEPADFLDYGASSTIPSQASQGLLPVNYIGTNAPANSNLLFCDFTNLTTLPVETNLPTVSITSPTSPLPATNLQGTASDDIGLAVVICVLTPQAATDGTYPYPYTNGTLVTNYASGTTNWSLNLYPGSYNVSVQAQNGAGDLSPPATNLVSVTTILTNGNGTVNFTNAASNIVTAVGYPFQDGTIYSVEATPGSNQLFVNWSASEGDNFNQEVEFSMFEGFVLTATFISNGIPNSIAFTYPAPNGIVSNNTFNITGAISNVPSNTATITCQIYSVSNDMAVGPALTVIGTNTWSVTESNLAVGYYIVQAIAMDSNGDQTLITNNFSVTTNAPLLLEVVGPGSVSTPTNGQLIPVLSTFQATANPDSNQFFYTWTYGTEVSLNPVQTFTMSGASTLTATFVSNSLPSNSITFTSPTANVVLSNYSLLVGGTISSNGVSLPLTVTCQIFSQTNGLAMLPAQSTSGTTNWSLTMNELPAGNYIALVEAVDQARNSTVISNNFRAIVDTNAPGLSILYPGANTILGDNSPLIVSGTASDTNGLAWVHCYMMPVANGDGTVPNQGIGLGGYALGTTNWSLNFGIMPPGVYSNSVAVLDNAGNFNESVQLVTNTGILINGDGSVSLTQAGVVKTNPVGYPLQYQAAYKVVATPAAGSTFVGWSEGAYTTANPAVSFTNAQGLLWTATFVRSNAGKGISFIYPSANARLTTNSFRLKGRMRSGYESAPVNWKITSLTTGFGVGPLLAASGASAWSAAVSNLPPDNYVVEAVATNAAGQTSVIAEKFSIVAFANVAGTYSGLFICSDKPVTPTNSGFLTFTLTPAGAISGRLVFPAYAPIPIYPVFLNNSYFTVGSMSTGIADFHGKPLDVIVQMDLSNGTDIATGVISSDTWSSGLNCYREVTKLSSNTVPATGKYILSLQPAGQTNGPGTNGYAALSVSSGGAIALSGALPDNATFSQSARVSKEGIWPLYVVPAGYKTNGLLIGWETNNASGSCSGQLYWYKAPNIGGYYSGGVGVVSNMLVSSGGTNYVHPTNGSQYSIIFGGGTILPPLTNNLGVNEKGQLFVEGSPSDNLKISLSANGVITGSLLNTNDNQTLRFKGAFIGASQGGSGFIPDAGGQTGWFELEPAPR